MPYIPQRLSVRPVRETADCKNCPCPLTKSYGKWVHHWLYANACQTPTAVEGTETRTLG